MTIPYKWQRSSTSPTSRSGRAWTSRCRRRSSTELYRLLPDFRRAYDADGMRLEEFDSYGATVRTLRGFIGSYQDLVAVIRDFMLPNPDHLK